MNEQLLKQCNYFANPDAWLSLTALILSIIALFQTSKQIRLSNKHQLFDRRLEKYLLVKELVSIYKTYRHLIVNKKSMTVSTYFQFALLTNCAPLENISYVINEPLEEAEENSIFRQLEILEKSAVEFELLWNCDIGKTASRFVTWYAELLLSMYQQQKCLNNLPIDVITKHTDLEDFYPEMKGLNSRLLYCIDKLDKTYTDIVNKKIEQKLTNSIRF